MRKQKTSQKRLTFSHSHRLIADGFTVHDFIMHRINAIRAVAYHLQSTKQSQRSQYSLRTTNRSQ